MSQRRVTLSSLVAAARTRRWLAVLLAIYALPALLLPAVHIVSEAIETSGCEACAAPVRAPAGAVSMRQACTPDAPCKDPTHHHHTHPFHRADHCPICANVGNALLASPERGVSMEAPVARVAVCTSNASWTVVSASRSVELARAPPSPRSV